MTGLFIFLFGLVFGSFINVVLWRLQTGESLIFPASHCPKCRQQISWFDNIPVLSYLLLRGRCRQCQKTISVQYPLIELVAALIFVILYRFFGLTDQFLILAVFSLFLLVVFVYDLWHYLILDQVVIPGMIFAALANLYLGLVWWDLLLAAIIGGGFFWLQYVISQGRWIGGGDIRLGALMGLMLGWQMLLVALFIAYLCGAAVGLVLISAGKKKMSSAIPFGTFLSLAAFVAFLFGPQILNWY